MNFIHNHPLTEQEVKDLRACQTICIDYDPARKVSQIRGYIKIDTKHGQLEKEVKADIDTRVTLYRRDSWGQYNNDDIYPGMTCFVHMPRYEFNQRGIDAVLKLLRPGDVLEARYTEAGNGYINGSKCTVKDDRGAGFICQDEAIYHQYCELAILREGKHGRGVYVCIQVDDRIGPANSAAMVRYQARMAQVSV